MAELKSCPLCGSKDISTSWGIGRRITNIPECYWIIGCGCGATMIVRVKVADDSDDDLPTMKEGCRIATERWNKRVKE